MIGLQADQYREGIRLTYAMSAVVHAVSVFVKLAEGQAFIDLVEAGFGDPVVSFDAGQLVWWGAAVAIVGAGLADFCVTVALGNDVLGLDTHFYRFCVG